MFKPAEVTRALRYAGAIALLVAATNVASAQGVVPANRTWQLRIADGAFIGTGAQRDQLKDGHVTAIQISRMIGARMALTGTFGWARSKDLGAVDAPKLDVFTSDIGLEAHSAEWFATAPVSISAFAGVGGGARSYNYRKLDVDATNNLAAYVAAGSEIGMGRVALRIEARDYATGFKPLIGGGASEARNDVVLMGSLRFNRRSAGAR